MITRRNVDATHHHGIHVIAVGETEDLSAVVSDAAQIESFQSQGANTICVHPTQDPLARERICKELTDHYLAD